MSIYKYLRTDHVFSQRKAVASLRLEDADEGICMALSMQWMANSHLPGADPEQEFLKIQGQGPFYFKQLATNHLTYLSHFGARNKGANGQDLASTGSFLTMIQLVSRGSLTIQVGDGRGTATTRDQLSGFVADATAVSPLGSCFIQLITASYQSHLIAAIEESTDVTSSTWRVFDPNFGLLICDIALSRHTLGDLLSQIWQLYGLIHAKCYPIASA